MKNTVRKMAKLCWVSLWAIIFTVLFWSILGITRTNTSEYADHKRETLGVKRLAYDEVKKDNIEGTIQKLEQYGERSSWRNQTEAIDWTNAQFRTLGIDSWVETYEIDGKTWPNLCARIRGKMNPSSTIMVIAHIDSISRNPEEASPGADDNGSGIAVLLESARILSKHSFEKSIQFCIFTNEERGKKGSKAYARKARAEGHTIEAIINLDTLGYSRPSLPMYWRGLWNHSSFRNTAKAAYRTAQNLWLSLFEGQDVVVVAGRPANVKLVGVTANKLRKSSKIRAKEIVGDDCG